MPGWVMHIKIANEIVKKFNISNTDEDLFRFGCVMPDNEGYVVEGLSNIGLYDTSHFARHQKIGNVEFNLPDQNKFLSEYRNKLSDPIVLGCFVHILSDYFFNYNTFKYKYYANDIGNIVGVRLIDNHIFYTDKDTMRIYKQGDFEKYSRKIYPEIDPRINKNSIDTIYKNCKIIKEIKYTKEDVEKIVKYLDDIKTMYADKDYDEIQYHVYSEENLNAMMNNCVEYVEKQIIKNMI